MSGDPVLPSFLPSLSPLDEPHDGGAHAERGRHVEHALLHALDGGALVAEVVQDGAAVVQEVVHAAVGPLERGKTG